MHVRAKHERVRADPDEPELAVKGLRSGVALPDAEPERAGTALVCGVDDGVHQLMGDAAAMMHFVHIETPELDRLRQVGTLAGRFGPKLRVRRESAVVRDHHEGRHRGIRQVAAHHVRREGRRTIGVHVLGAIVCFECLPERSLGKLRERLRLRWRGVANHHLNCLCAASADSRA